MAVLVIHPVLVGCNEANDAIHGPGSLHLLAVERENVPRGVWYLDEAPGFNSPDHKSLQEESQMHANRNDKRQGKDEGPHPQSKNLGNWLQGWRPATYSLANATCVLSSAILDIETKYEWSQDSCTA